MISIYELIPYWSWIFLWLICLGLMKFISRSGRITNKSTMFGFYCYAPNPYPLPDYGDKNVLDEALNSGKRKKLCGKLNKTVLICYFLISIIVPWAYVELYKFQKFLDVIEIVVFAVLPWLVIWTSKDYKFDSEKFSNLNIHNRSQLNADTQKIRRHYLSGKCSSIVIPLGFISFFIFNKGWLQGNMFENPLTLLIIWITVPFLLPFTPRVLRFLLHFAVLVLKLLLHLITIVFHFCFNNSTTIVVENESAPPPPLVGTTIEAQIAQLQEFIRVRNAEDRARMPETGGPLTNWLSINRDNPALQVPFGMSPEGVEDDLILAAFPELQRAAMLLAVGEQRYGGSSVSEPIEVDGDDEEEAPVVEPEAEPTEANVEAPEIRQRWQVIQPITLSPDIDNIQGISGRMERRLANITPVNISENNSGGHVEEPEEELEEDDVPLTTDRIATIIAQIRRTGRSHSTNNA